MNWLLKWFERRTLLRRSIERRAPAKDYAPGRRLPEQARISLALQRQWEDLTNRPLFAPGNFYAFGRIGLDHPHPRRASDCLRLQRLTTPPVPARRLIAGPSYRSRGLDVPATEWLTGGSEQLLNPSELQPLRGSNQRSCYDGRRSQDAV